MALRRAGGRFGAPRRLATGRIRGVAAAIGASGDVLVAWDSLGVLRARFKPRGRDGFRAAERIRSRPAFFAQMRPVVTANGRAVLAWSAQFASEGGEPGDAFFQAAVRPAGGDRFRRATLLERISPGEGAVGRPIDAVDDSTGDVVIAWSGSDGSDRRVRAARVEQSGDAGPAQTLSPPGADALLSDLASGPAGRLLAVWDGGIEDPASTVEAALSSAADQPFGAPELVSPAGQEARSGAGAFDPATGRPTVLYSNRPEGSGGTIDQIRTYAEASTRSE